MLPSPARCSARARRYAWPRSSSRREAAGCCGLTRRKCLSTTRFSSRTISRVRSSSRSRCRSPRASSECCRTTRRPPPDRTSTTCAPTSWPSDPKSWAIARDLYEQALQEDPRYAPAWARLGRLHRLIGKLGGGSSDDLARAEAALQRALELNPDLPLAHNLTAQIDIDRGRARDAMVRLLGQASRRSTDPELFAGLVYACRYCGLLGASLRADARARRLDPSIKTSVIHTLWMLRDHDAVVASTVEAPVVVGFSLAALGRTSEALAFLAEKQGKVPPRIRQIIGALRALLEGHPAETIAAIEDIVASGFRDSEGLYYLGEATRPCGSNLEGGRSSGACHRGGLLLPPAVRVRRLA